MDGDDFDKDGEPHAKPLTPDGVEAFRLLVKVSARGFLEAVPRIAQVARQAAP